MSKRGVPESTRGGDKDQPKRAHLEESLQEALAPQASLHDAQDEELDTKGMPVGWRMCPRLGRPVWRFIPAKVPLGPHFDDQLAESDRFTVQDAVKAVHEILQGVKVNVPVPPSKSNPNGGLEDRPAQCSMVIDLTNSSRYYRRETFEEMGFYHLKIPNRGRGEVPAPQAVNDFVFEVQSYLHRCPEGYILVHCTHGYNRTGFMIVSHLLRMLSDPTTTVGKALRGFAEARPPGIYKPYYVKALYRYYHERAPRDLPPPPLPEWKAGASPDRGEDHNELDDHYGAVGPGLHHDDPVGEAVSKSEADWVRGILMQYLMGVVEVPPGRAIFPGSQPVSLARSNLGLLAEQKYWVTWKADGTRYLVLIMRTGTYLIDRANVVTRVQMRWPTPLPPPVSRSGVLNPRAPVSDFHSGTILDGEMVVDEDPKTKQRTRRFLAYDLMAVNAQNVMRTPWWQRWETIDRFIQGPRRLEGDAIAKGTWALRYEYAGEAFRFRRKDFWPLTAASKLIHEFIPRQISHEADGLIFQPYDEYYKPLTCESLLKWKFAHLNSVDFKLKVTTPHLRGAGETSEPLRLTLQLLHPPTKGVGAPTISDLPDARVIFPDGINPRAYDGRIIECSWDASQKAWSFMRDRRDKTLPNAYSVYEKVVVSIKDDIKEDELLRVIGAAAAGPVYQDDAKLLADA